MDFSQLGGVGKQNVYLILGIQLVIGLIFGLIPLLLSLRRGKRNLGIIALAVSLILSLLSPILSLIAVVVFVILIVRKPAAAE